MRREKTETVTKRIVILGGGTGGTPAANRLRRDLGEQPRITVVDRDDDHVYQPGCCSCRSTQPTRRPRRYRSNTALTDYVDWLGLTS